MNQRNLVLIGYRATGKTSLGRILATQLHRPLVDLDQALEQELGQTIAAFVAQAGWEEFRRREKNLVAHYAQQKGLVIATGGGVVTDDDNIRRLRKTGWVVWLKASPPAITMRLAAPGEADKRPSLTGQDLCSEVAEVLRQREPLYRAAADLEIDTEHITLAEAAQEIMTAFLREETAIGG